MVASSRKPELPALADSGGVVLAPLDYPPLRVLIVDDNIDASESLGMLLGMVGFAIRVHHNGRTALDEAARFEPEACILDISMPEMDGCELARHLRIKQGNRELLLLAVTALSADDAVHRISSAGFDRHIVKPAQPQVILDILFEYERRRRENASYI